MTIDNERLVEYLGLELELCYLKSSGDAVWILADRIRRKDNIAVEMLRLFHRWARIAKSLDAINAPIPPAQDSDMGGRPAPRSATNAPYAACIGVRIWIQEYTAAFHVRPGSDVGLLGNAPRISGNMLLDPSFHLSVDDPIVQMLARPQPAKASPSSRPKALKK